MKNEIKDNMKDLEKLLKDTEGVVLGTTNGTAVIGNGLVLLNILSNIAKSLKEMGIKEEDVIEAIKSGFNYDEDSIKEINKKAKELLKEISKKLNKMLEDDKDE